MAVTGGIPVGEEVKSEPTGFFIQLIRFSSNTNYDALFVKAAQRWKAILVNKLSHIPRGAMGDLFEGAFYPHGFIGEVHNMVIGFSVGPIDGAGSGGWNKLGFAKPVKSRNDNGQISTISGIMKFDEWDFSQMTTNDIPSYHHA